MHTDVNAQMPGTLPIQFSVCLAPDRGTPRYHVSARLSLLVAYSSILNIELQNNHTASTSLLHAMSEQSRHHTHTHTPHPDPQLQPQPNPSPHPVRHWTPLHKCGAGFKLH